MATPTTHLQTPKLIGTDRLVRERECRAITGLSRQRRWELEAEGRFPKRIALGSRTIAWRLSELEAWIEDVAGRRAL